jgi:hypothetical protein
MPFSQLICAASEEAINAPNAIFAVDDTIVRLRPRHAPMFSRPHHIFGLNG